MMMVMIIIITAISIQNHLIAANHGKNQTEEMIIKMILKNKMMKKDINDIEIMTRKGKKKDTNGLMNIIMKEKEKEINATENMKMKEKEIKINVTENMTIKKKLKVNIVENLKKNINRLMKNIKKKN